MKKLILTHLFLSASIALLFIFVMARLAFAETAIKKSNATYWFDKGYALLKAGGNEEAIMTFTRVIQLNPRFLDAYFDRGLAYAKLGDHLKAIKDFDRAIELNPKYVNAYYFRGATYGKLGDLQQEIKDFRTAARLGHKAAQDFLRSNGIGW
jgi:tetratricopeptide (TPR) repeat protein